MSSEPASHHVKCEKALGYSREEALTPPPREHTGAFTPMGPCPPHTCIGKRNQKGQDLVKPHGCLPLGGGGKSNIHDPMYSSDNQCTAALKASRASGVRKGASIPSAHLQGCGPQPRTRSGVCGRSGSRLCCSTSGCTGSL